MFPPSELSANFSSVTCPLCPYSDTKSIILDVQVKEKG